MQKVYPIKVAEYLENKSYKQWDLEWNESPGIDFVLVIPSISEFENIKVLLSTLAQNPQSYLKKSLIVFVVNNSILSGTKIKSDNKQSLDYLRELIRQVSSDQFSNQILKSGIKVGLIDAASEGKEFDDIKAGVGLARKIGMDAALRVFDYSVGSKKIIISLDADCQIEVNYLSEIENKFNQHNVSVAIVDFEHTLPEDEIRKHGIRSY